MVRNLDIALNILLAGGHVGKHRRQQIVGADALNLGRHFLSALKTQQCQRAASIPTPARGKNRRCQRRLLKNGLHRLGLQKLKYICQRETVLFCKGNIQPVIGHRCLQLEIKTATEALAQRQSPGLVDPSAERRMDHQLHPTAFIEKAFCDDGVLRGYRAQHRPPLQDVLDGLFGAGIIQPALLLQPLHSRGHFRIVLRDPHRRSVN